MNFRTAAFLLVCLSASSAETDAPADALAAAVATRTARDQAQDKAEGYSRESIPAREKVSALDPEEPSNKSLAVVEPFGLDAVPVREGNLLTQWDNVRADIRAESRVLAHCESSAFCPSARREPSLPLLRKAAPAQVAPASA